jgi:hypothetical protein
LLLFILMNVNIKLAVNIQRSSKAQNQNYEMG